MCQKKKDKLSKWIICCWSRESRGEPQKKLDGFEIEEERISEVCSRWYFHCVTNAFQFSVANGPNSPNPVASHSPFRSIAWLFLWFVNGIFITLTIYF